jgi:hypothetical protein
MRSTYRPRFVQRDSACNLEAPLVLGQHAKILTPSVSVRRRSWARLRLASCFRSPYARCAPRAGDLAGIGCGDRLATPLVPCRYLRLPWAVRFPSRLEHALSFSLRLYWSAPPNCADVPHLAPSEQRRGGCGHLVSLTSGLLAGLALTLARSVRPRS